jgi:uncharacterized protein (TIGR03437 family)
VAAVNGKFYVLGAIRIGTSFIDGNTYEYDPAADRWTTVGRMGAPRGASGVAAIGSTIYVAGGLTISGSVATFAAFDTTTKQWIQLPDMPTARDHLTAQALNGKFYAIAGRVGADVRANEEYDPATRTWRSRAGIPTARGGLASGNVRGRIQVFGGEGNSGTPEGTFAQHEEYDPVSDTWGTLTLMPFPRHGLYGATLDNRIFAPSGGPRAGAFFSDTHDAYFMPPVDAPAISPNGLRNAATLTGALAPGAIVALMGAKLAYAEQIAIRFPIPTQMNAITVRVNGVAVPLLYVGPDQINFHLPYTFTPGPLDVKVTHVTTESAVLQTVDVSPVAPGIFALNGHGDGQGAIVIAGTSVIARAAGDSSRPARRGELVSIYCNGLGQVNGAPRAGQPTPDSPPVPTLETPEVMIGGARAEVMFSGLTPQTVGLYQINARVPDQAATGPATQVMIQISGRTSNTVTMAVE